MRCGARVVCTHLAVPDRMCCTAECACRNYTNMKEIGCKSDVIEFTFLARACLYIWGDAIKEVVMTERK